MLIRDLSFDVYDEPPRRGRRLMAALLRVASQRLDRLAERLSAPQPVESGDPLIEYHAEAGAPEGVLFLDGRLVGRLEGVNRL